MDQAVNVDGLIDTLLDREGGYVNHPADKGGPTCFGITEAVARAHGYRGAMRQLSRGEAVEIYRRLYWLRPRFDEVAKRSPRVAGELFDTGANMGPAVAATFMQRALTALNRNGKDYADLVPDGRIGGGHALRARHLPRRSLPEQRGDRAPARARGAPGRALPPPRRAPPCQRGVPVRLASEPYW
jgi:lysozyme family protein